MTLRLILVLLALAALGGCGAKDESVATDETKPAAVKLDMAKSDQDALAAKVGAWDPKKDPK